MSIIKKIKEISTTISHHEDKSISVNPSENKHLNRAFTITKNPKNCSKANTSKEDKRCVHINSNSKSETNARGQTVLQKV